MKRILPLVVVAGALVAPSTAFAGGVVLKVQKANHLIAVRTTASNVALVHTASATRLRVGQRVALNARALRNGTFAATQVSVIGRVHRTTFRGLVLARTRTRLVLSAGGAVLAVHRAPRSTASARDSAPPPGTTVTVGVTIKNDGELSEDFSTFSPTSPGGRIEGQLLLGAGTITVSADDATLVLKVPSGFDLTGFQNGDEVLATFAQAQDGSLTLTALSGDENAQRADCHEGQQGDQSGQQGDQSGQGDDAGDDDGGGDGGFGGE
jgi:hypothetical protein